MDPGKALLVVGITLIVVIGFNVMIYFSSRGDRTVNQVEMFRRAAKRIRSPWIVEDTMLEELSQATARLKEDKANQESEADTPDGTEV